MDRKTFVRTLFTSISAALLAACKRVVPEPSPTATKKPKVTETPSPIDTPTASHTSTPELPEICDQSMDIEVYLFGIGATRVEGIEELTYKIVLDKNINAGALYAEVEFILLAELNQTLTYQVLWLNEDNELIDIYDAIYNQYEGQVSCKISELRKDDLGFFAAAVLLSDDEVLLCQSHPDFKEQIIYFDSKSFLLIQPLLKFEPVLVKSRTGGGSSGSEGPGTGGTGEGPGTGGTGGGPSSGVSGTGTPGG